MIVNGNDKHSDDLSYSSYLSLPELLSLQHRRTIAHDELLFIVMHQTYELWFRLILHELEAARSTMDRGDSYLSIRSLRRVVTTAHLLIAQMDVLDTMTPQDFLRFRSDLGSASGAQSAQFREIELISGLKDPSYPHGLSPTAVEDERLRRRFLEPSLWDSFVSLLQRRRCPALTALFDDSDRWRDLFQLSEALIEYDQVFSLWRIRHVQLVERQIGSKTGTGGSSGDSHLRATLSKRFFPLLWEARSGLTKPN